MKAKVWSKKPAMGITVTSLLAAGSLFLPWASSSVFSSSENGFSAMLNPLSPVVLALSLIMVVLSVFYSISGKKALRISGGIIGVISGIVIAGMSLLAILSMKLLFSGSDLWSVGYGGPVAITSGIAMIICSILVLKKR